MNTIMNEMWRYMENVNGPKIFSINDFANIANHNTIRSNLMRMSDQGKIVKLLDGLYAIPEYSKLLDSKVYPNANDVAEKIAEKFQWQIVPTDENALNATGFSTQVPNKLTFASDGPYRKYNYNDIEIIFKNTSSRYLRNLSKNTALMVQVMKVIGKKNFSQKEIKRLLKFYKKNSNKDIYKEVKNIPVWMQEVINEMVEDINETVY